VNSCLLQPFYVHGKKVLLKLPLRFLLCDFGEYPQIFNVFLLAEDRRKIGFTNQLIEIFSAVLLGQHHTARHGPSTLNDGPCDADLIRQLFNFVMVQDDDFVSYLPV